MIAAIVCISWFLLMLMRGVVVIPVGKYITGFCLYDCFLCRNRYDFAGLSIVGTFIQAQCGHEISSGYARNDRQLKISRASPDLHDACHMIFMRLAGTSSAMSPPTRSVFLVQIFPLRYRTKF